MSALRSRPPIWLTDLLLVLVLAAAALFVRLQGLGEIVGDGQIWIYPDDPPYHLRRAMMTLSSWPRVPTFDPFLNFPDGATVYWPPGLAWLLAGVCRLLALPPTREAVERVALWIPPLVGALTVALVYVGCRRSMGRVVGGIVALVLVVMPIHWHYTLASRFDHHAFEPLLCWLLLWSLARGATSRRPAGWIAIGAASIGLGLAVWPGVLLHLALLVLVLLVGLWHLSTGPRLARVGARVFGLSLLLAIPLVGLSPWSTRFVFFAPSALHLVCLAATTALCALVGWPLLVLRRISHRGRLLLLTGVGMLPFLVVPPLRRALATGLAYALQGSLAVFSDEAHSLLHTSSASLTGWAPLLCLGPCVVLLLLRRSRAMSHDPLLFLTVVAAVVLALPAVVQQRWLVAWSPFGAATVGAAWCLALAHARPARRHQIAALVALAGLLTPSVLEALSHPMPFAEQRAAESFLRRIRRLTPPAAADEYSASARPTYGVLTSWSIGHLFTHLAGRPALANNFWGLPVHDAANRAALRLYLSQDCEAVAREMERRQLRYVLITPVDPRKMLRHADLAGLPRLASLLDGDRLRPEAATLFVLRLGIRDGESFVLPGASPRVVPACGRFALVAETLLRGDAPRDEAGDFKLYRRVVGARASIACPPGSVVQASLPLHTERGRRVSWSSLATCGPTGRVMLRLPYPTDGGRGPVRATAAHYVVRSGARQFPLTVSAGAVEHGAWVTGGPETCRPGLDLLPTINAGAP